MANLTFAVNTSFLGQGDPIRRYPLAVSADHAARLRERGTGHALGRNATTSPPPPGPDDAFLQDSAGTGRPLMLYTGKPLRCKTPCSPKQRTNRFGGSPRLEVTADTETPRSNAAVANATTGSGSSRPTTGSSTAASTIPSFCAGVAASSSRSRSTAPRAPQLPELHELVTSLRQRDPEERRRAAELEAHLHEAAQLCSSVSMIVCCDRGPGEDGATSPMDGCVLQAVVRPKLVLAQAHHETHAAGEQYALSPGASPPPR